MKTVFPMKRIIYPLLCILFLLPLGCSSLFFYPRKQLYDNPAAQRFSPEDVYFKSSDGLMLHGWFFPATQQEVRGTILVFHGNSENLSTHINSVLWLVNEGFNLFIFDYRGYGRSEGSPDINGVHADAAAALDTVTAMPRVKDTRLVLLGQSLGGAIAVYTAATSPHKDRIAGLVVDSAFASYRLIAREKLGRFILTWPFQYPLSFLFNDTYSPDKWIGTVSPIPVLILHGVEDRVVPPHHGQLLYDAALPRKDIWKTGEPGHVRAFADKRVREEMLQYLGTLVDRK